LIFGADFVQRRSAFAISQGELLDTVMGIFAKRNQYASEAEQMSRVQQKGRQRSPEDFSCKDGFQFNTFP